MTLYTKREAAKLLKISEHTLHLMLRRGEMEHVRVGHSPRITEAQIEEYIKRQTVPAR